MGLDQYAMKWKEGEEKKKLFYWRKHPALQDWMEKLWEVKGRPGFDAEEHGGALGDFNCVPVGLEKDDLLKLRQLIKDEKLNYGRRGFFFGNSASPGDEYYQEQKSNDLKFIREALAALKRGFKVEYTAWW